MAFEGDLRHLSLGDVLQTLAMSRQVGTFIVRSPLEERRLSFGSRGCGLLTVRSAVREKVPQWLLGRAKITAEDLDAAQKLQRRRKDVLIEDLLLEKAQVTEADIKAARNYMAAEEIYDLFLLKEGTFEFLASETGDPQSYGDNWFDVTSVAMEAARRMDEVQHLREAAPVDEVFRRVNEDAPPPEPKSIGGDDAVRLYDFVDGTRTVDGILSEFHLGRFDTWKHLTTLVEKGLVRTSDAAEMTATAEELLRTKKHARAAAILQRSLALDPANADARRALVQALVAAGEKKQAAAEYVKKGAAEMADGDGQAVESYRQATRLDASNVDAIDGLARALFASGDLTAGADAARQASTLRLESGAHAAATEIAEIGVRACPEDVNLRIALANARIAGGDPADGLVMLNDAASLLETSGDDERRLLDVYKRILQLEPMRRDCARRIQEIEQSSRVRRRKLAQRVAIAAGVVVAALIAMPMFTRHSLERRVADAKELGDQGDIAAAISKLDEILDEDLSADEQAMARTARAELERRAAPTGPNRAENFQKRVQVALDRITAATGKDHAQALSAVAYALDLLESADAHAAQLADTKVIATVRKDAADEIESCLASLANDAMSAATKVTVARDKFTPEVFKREDANQLADLVQSAEDVRKLRASQDWNTVMTRHEALRKRLARPKDQSDVKTTNALQVIAEGFPVVEHDGERALAGLRKRQLIQQVVESSRTGQALMLEGHVEDAEKQYRSVVEFADSLRRSEPKELYEPIVREFLDPARNDITRSHRELLTRIETIRRTEEEANAALAAGDVAKTYNLRVALCRDHKIVDFRDRFRLPLRIESQPPGAEVEMVTIAAPVPGATTSPAPSAARALGRTPLPLVEIPIDGTTRLKVRSLGFQERTVERSGASDNAGPLVKVELAKIAEFTSEKGRAVQAAAVGADGRVFLAGRDGVVRNLSGADGTETASRALGLLDGVAGAPVLFGGRLFVAALDRVVVCLDPRDLSETGRAKLDGAARGSLLLTPYGAVCADESGVVQMFDTSMRSVWSQNVGKVQVDPALAGNPGNRVVLVTAAGEMKILDVGRGSVDGRVALADDPRWSAPVVAGERAYAGGDGGHVTCVNLATKVVAWTIRLDSAVSARPAVVGGRVVVATANGSIYFLDAGNGDIRLRIAAGAPIRQAVLGLPDGFVIATDRGGVIRFDRDGNVVWRYDIKDDLIAPPALVEGRIVVVSSKGVAHALKP